MTIMSKSKFITSLRENMKELDDKIADALIAIDPESLYRAGRFSKVDALRGRRDGIIAAIEAAEEADDLIWDLQCAISDATDYNGISEDSLRSALEYHGLVVSRAENPASPRVRISKICGG